MLFRHVAQPIFNLLFAPSHSPALEEAFAASRQDDGSLRFDERS